MDLTQLEATPAWEWPEDAADLILAGLRDENAGTEERMLAAYLAGDATVVNDTLAGALISIACDSSAAEPLRAQAAIALGPALEHADLTDFEDPDDILISEELFHSAQALLKKLFQDSDCPKEVRRRVLEASVRAPQDWHADAIGNAYGSDDNDWRLSAVFGMQYIEGFDDQILASLKDPDPDIHLEAVCAAGNWGLETAWDHIAGLVGDEGTEKELRMVAMEAAVGIRPEQADAVLNGLLAHDDPDIVDAAQEALAMAEAMLAEPDDDGAEEDD